jgi:hypothetical protein
VILAAHENPLRIVEREKTHLFEIRHFHIPQFPDCPPGADVCLEKSLIYAKKSSKTSGSPVIQFCPDPGDHLTCADGRPTEPAR